jgi:hypothetical protein
MNTFLLLFRADYSAIEVVAPEVMQQRNADWMAWLKGISAEGKLVEGNHLGNDGRIVKGKNEVVEGTVTNEGTSILGYLLVSADSYNDAVNIAKACPILEGKGNSVEVRALHAVDLNH